MDLWASYAAADFRVCLYYAGHSGDSQQAVSDPSGCRCGQLPLAHRNLLFHVHQCSLRPGLPAGGALRLALSKGGSGKRRFCHGFLGTVPEHLPGIHRHYGQPFCAADDQKLPGSGEERVADRPLRAEGAGHDGGGPGRLFCRDPVGVPLYRGGIQQLCDGKRERQGKSAW